MEMPKISDELIEAIRSQVIAMEVLDLMIRDKLWEVKDGNA